MHHAVHVGAGPLGRVADSFGNAEAGGRSDPAGTYDVQIFYGLMARLQVVPSARSTTAPRRGRLGRMRNQLQARTPAGEKFVELAEQHSDEIATRAAEHDQNGTFPHEAIDAMKASGFASGPLQEEFGGLGVASPYDVMVAVSRLARSDASVAIAINMHLTTGIIVNRLVRGAREANDPVAIGLMEGFAGLLGGGAIAMANATEPGTDIRHPLTEATRVDEGRRLDGRKIFGTLSPVADVMTVTARHKRDDGTWGRGRAIVFRGTPGQTIMENWDALGMRASGSHDVVYDNCVIPDSLYIDQGDWGAFDEENLLVSTAGAFGLIGAFLGIAEAARDHVVPMLKTRTKQPSGRVLAARHGIQHTMAELEIELATARAHLAFVGPALDDLISQRPVASVTHDDFHQGMSSTQIAKVATQRAAMNVVDLAMQLSGGAGYMTANPLSRLYRDVRAGPFMQPLSPNEAYEYIGQVALDQPVELEG